MYFTQAVGLCPSLTINYSLTSHRYKQQHEQGDTYTITHLLYLGRAT